MQPTIEDMRLEPMAYVREIIGMVYPEFRDIHSACKARGTMDSATFAALVEDIRQHGLSTPITLTPNGRILDGKMRLIACWLSGRQVRVNRLAEGSDCWGYVYRHNLLRAGVSDVERKQFQDQWHWCERQKAMAKQGDNGHDSNYACQ